MLSVTDSPVLTIAFVIAITAFLKDKLGTKGWRTILAAFLVILGLSYIPVIITLFPVAEPWLTPIYTIIVLMLGALGSVDFVKQVKSPV